MINWNNPITNKLVFDASMSEGGGSNLKDNVARVVGAFAGANFPLWKKRMLGNVLTFADNANNVLYTSSAIQNSLKQITLETLIFPTAVNAAGESRFIHKGSSTGVKYFDSSIITGNKIEFDIGFATADDAYDSPAIASLNAWYHVVSTYSFLGLGTVPKMYINGISQTMTRVNGSGAAGTDTTELDIGNRSAAGGSTKGFVGDIAYIRYWNRILTEPEIRSLYANPWQIYVKPRFQQPLNAVPAVVAGASQFWRNLIGVGQ